MVEESTEHDAASQVQVQTPGKYAQDEAVEVKRQEKIERVVGLFFTAVGLPGKQKIIAGKWGLPAARMRGGWVVE